jgi:hypothetical protein
MRIDGKKLSSCHQHPRRANAALCSAVFQKCLLQRVKSSARSEPFNGLNIGSLGVQHWHKATVHKFAIHAHGTRSAFAFSTSFLGPGEMEVFTQHIQ